MICILEYIPSMGREIAELLSCQLLVDPLLRRRACQNDHLAHLLGGAKLNEGRNKVNFASRSDSGTDLKHEQFLLIITKH